MERLTFAERYFDEDEINDNYAPTGFERPVSGRTVSRPTYGDSTNRYRLTCHESYYGDNFQVDHFSYEQDIKSEVLSYTNNNKLIFEEKYHVDDYECDNSSNDCHVGVADHEIKCYWNHSIGLTNPSDLDLKKIRLLEHNLKKIIREFKKCQKCCKQFLKVYPVWNKKRKSVISELKGIAETLDKTKFDCNVGKLVGSSVGAAGGVLTIIGAVLAPFTMGISTVLVIGGVATSVTGGVTSLGSSIADVAILKEKVQEAKDLLEKDKKEFHRVHQWFEHTVSYVDAINEIMDINIFSKIIHDLKELCFIFSETGETKSSGNTATDNVALLAKYLFDTVHGSVASSIIIQIINIPKLVKMFQEIIRLHHDNPVLFEALSLTSKICVLVARGMDIGAEFFTTALKAVDVGPMIATASVGKALSQGLFAGVGLAFDVTSLVLTSIDVHGGSKCPSAEEIKKANKQLKNELGIIEHVYLELLKCGM